MPKKKSSKNKPAPTSWVNNVKHPVVFYKNLSLWYKLVVIFVAVVLLLVIFVRASAFLKQQELEKDFKTIETSLRELSLEDKGFAVNKGCRKTVEKFSSGSLFCTISIGKNGASIDDYSALVAAVERSQVWKLDDKAELHQGINYAKVTHLPTQKRCTLDTTVKAQVLSSSLICSEYSSSAFYP